MTSVGTNPGPATITDPTLEGSGDDAIGDGPDTAANRAWQSRGTAKTPRCTS